MIPNITQEGPNIVEQYWCGNCGAGLPPPYQLRDGEHEPTWKFCPICGEAIEYERARPVQWAELNCERCGVNLIMEIQGEPKPRYIASRDYIGGSICRCCMEEHCAQTNCLQCEAGKQPGCPYTRLKKKPWTSVSTWNDLEEFQMNEQKKVHITIFQAPFASLIDLGLYMKMHDPKQPFQATVPAEYYLAVFDGEIECPKSLPPDKERRTYAILEQVFSIFNNALPTGYCSRSLSVGDIVQLEGLHYLCVVCGFVPVTFTTSRRSTAIEAPQTCTLSLPDGTVLRATAHPEPAYPCINIDLIAADGTEDHVCFVEHSLEKEPGHELCIGVYCAESDETVYYNSYHLMDGDEEGNND